MQERPINKNNNGPTETKAPPSKNKNKGAAFGEAHCQNKNNNRCRSDHLKKNNKVDHRVRPQ